MLCPGFLCLVLAVQGKAPPVWPVCPSPVEQLPERELFALRKQFRGAWLPAREDATPPPERLLAFHDREWLETQVPGLAAPLRAGWQRGQRLVLRRVFQLGASSKRATTLHLPGLSGAARVWLDGQPLDLPARLWAPTEVPLPDDWALGPHVLCVEILAEQEDPVCGELFLSRSERTHLTRLSASSPLAAGAQAALVTATAGQAGPAPLPVLLQLWKVGPPELRALDEVRTVDRQETTTAFRVHGQWSPGRPESWLVRATLLAKDGAAVDVRVLGVAPRGYQLENEGLRAGGRTQPLFVVAARFTPGTDLPDQIQTQLVRWRNDGATCVLVAAPVHPALLDAADRLGVLVLLEVPDPPAVAAIERAWAHHPSLLGFVVPLDTGSVRSSSLPVFVRTERGLVRPGAVTAAGALVLLEGTHGDAASVWSPASSAGAAGMVVPESRAAGLRALR